MHHTKQDAPTLQMMAAVVRYHLSLVRHVQRNRTAGDIDTLQDPGSGFCAISISARTARVDSTTDAETGTAGANDFIPKKTVIARFEVSSNSDIHIEI